MRIGRVSDEWEQSRIGQKATMSSTETTNLAVFHEAAMSLPAPVSTSLFKAISNLLGGLTAIPAAWVKRPAQAIEDTTIARSTVAVILAKSVAERAMEDPVLMQAAAEIYLPTAIRKAENRVRVAQLAIEHASETTENSAEAATPDDDWMNAFTRFAEDASSEKLQDMFGRILAGQVVQPGSFALATIRTAAELDQQTADDFSHVWARSVGEAVDYSSDFQRGVWFSRWKRLAEAGLMAADHTLQFLPPYNPILNGNSLWSPMSVGDMNLLVHFSESCTARWSHIDFTRVGRQLGSILAAPDYGRNFQEAGRRLVSRGIERVELHRGGGMIEVIYAATDK